jgi:6-phosphogluconate dehydrogenase
MSNSPATCDIGVIGLAVMGENLASNIADRGYKVAVFNRTTAKVNEFVARSGTSPNIVGTHDLKEFCARLKRPRRLMMMVKAGEVVDQTIAQVEPYLEKGDILIDGGNSLFTDTERRCADLEKKGLLFVGAGVSGGEEGARHGPSIMPGGHEAAWPHVKEILQAIAAKAIDGTPCCRWVGSGGAGHYVKMVHNGIEYGDMQLIGEAYQLLKDGLGLEPAQLAKTFAAWNKTELDSFLIEITAAIFGKLDEDGSPLIDQILDAAGQKGTGKWTAISALDLGMPVTLIGESVFARCLSALKEQRVAASRILKGPPAATVSAAQAEFIESVRSALYCSKIISYAQGYMLLQAAEKERGWKLNFGEIAMLWSGGCIIRSVFLGDIKNAFEKDPALANLLLDEFFRAAIDKYQRHWRNALIEAIKLGIPTPAFSTALAFYDGYRTARLPANLLQAQRDFFGAHTYERVDKPRGKFFHTNWTGRGGAVTSSTYDA